MYAYVYIYVYIYIKPIFASLFHLYANHWSHHAQFIVLYVSAKSKSIQTEIWGRKCARLAVQIHVCARAGKSCIYRTCTYIHTVCAHMKYYAQIHAPLHTHRQSYVYTQV